MKWLFWLSVALIAYPYAGYPLWAYFRSRWWPSPWVQEEILPTVSVVLAVHDEGERIAPRLQNLHELDYPPERLEIITVSDGSRDATNTILSQYRGDRLHVIQFPEHRGKAAALNAGIREAGGEIVVFTDARQRLEPSSVRALVDNFADPSVGCVTGELVLYKEHQPAVQTGVSLYWRYEKWIRKCEGSTDSTMGATGALYAARRELLVTLPEGTILDDVYLPLQVVRQGYRCVFDARARAWEPMPVSYAEEFRRKVRTLTGNYQLLRIAPWLLTRANRARFEFVSHKLMRLLVPLALVGAFLASLFLTGTFYRLAFLAQVLFYGLGAVAIGRPRLQPGGRLAGVALTFLLLNAAASVALMNFVTGKKEVWTR